MNRKLVMTKYCVPHCITQYTTPIQSHLFCSPNRINFYQGKPQYKAASFAMAKYGIANPLLTEEVENKQKMQR